MRHTEYHVGGYLQGDAASNRAEEWDDAAGTYTRWSPDGVLLEQRDLTADEVAQLVAEETALAGMANVTTLLSRIDAGIVAMRADVDAPAPSALDMSTLRDLHRRTRAVERLLLSLAKVARGDYDDISGTA